MTTEPDTTLEPDNDNEGADATDPVEHEAILVELGIADETIDATPEEVVALVASMARSLNKELPQDAGGERGHPRGRDIGVDRVEEKGVVSTLTTRAGQEQTTSPELTAWSAQVIG